MFGPTMRFQVEKSGLTVELAPLKKEEMPLFVETGGMQSYEVLKFLGRTSAAVIEDEYEWFEKTRQSKDDLVWVIYVIDGDSRIIIGTTGLHDINSDMWSPYKTATSGFMIFRPEYWGKGIAGACHRARTMYAFDVIGLVCIRSGVIFENEASRRAVESVGYVVHHTDRMHGLYMGEPRQDFALQCINPDKYVWNYWWRDQNPGKKWRDARKRTAEALDWARTNVTLP